MSKPVNLDAVLKGMVKSGQISKAQRKAVLRGWGSQGTVPPSLMPVLQKVVAALMPAASKTVS